MTNILKQLQVFSFHELTPKYVRYQTRKEMIRKPDNKRNYRNKFMETKTEIKINLSKSFSYCFIILTPND